MKVLERLMDYLNLFLVNFLFFSIVSILSIGGLDSLGSELFPRPSMVPVVPAIGYHLPADEKIPLDLVNMASAGLTYAIGLGHIFNGSGTENPWGKKMKKEGPVSHALRIISLADLHFTLNIEQFQKKISQPQNFLFLLFPFSMDGQRQWHPVWIPAGDFSIYKGRVVLTESFWNSSIAGQSESFGAKRNIAYWGESFLKLRPAGSEWGMTFAFSMPFGFHSILPRKWVTSTATFNEVYYGPDSITGDSGLIKFSLHKDLRKKNILKLEISFGVDQRKKGNLGDAEINGNTFDLDVGQKDFAFKIAGHLDAIRGPMKTLRKFLHPFKLEVMAHRLVFYLHRPLASTTTAALYNPATFKVRSSPKESLLTYKVSRDQVEKGWISFYESLDFKCHKSKENLYRCEQYFSTGKSLQKGLLQIMKEKFKRNLMTRLTLKTFQEEIPQLQEEWDERLQGALEALENLIQQHLVRLKNQKSLMEDE